MTMSIAEELRETFHLAILRREAKVLLTGRQWEQREALVLRCQKARNKEKALFKERYDARIKAETKRLMDQGGSKNRALKPVWGQEDLFDRDALLQQADKNVRTAHQNRLNRIEKYEEHGLETLMQKAKRENSLQGNATRSFNHKSDRRSGHERRKRQTQTQQR